MYAKVNKTRLKTDEIYAKLLGILGVISFIFCSCKGYISLYLDKTFVVGFCFVLFQN